MAVTLNDKYLKGVVNADELKGMEPMVKVAHEMIENKNGLGNAQDILRRKQHKPYIS